MQIWGLSFKCVMGSASFLLVDINHIKYEIRISKRIDRLRALLPALSLVYFNLFIASFLSSFLYDFVLHTI